MKMALYEDDELKQIIRKISSMDHHRPVSLVVIVAPVVYRPQYSRLLQSISETISSKSGDDLIQYILRDLSCEEREIVLAHEKYRLLTFKVNWPYKSGNLSGEKMAAAGFFALNEGDKVQCTFCSGVLNDWDLGDSPLEEHRECYPFCPFVRETECGNIPLDHGSDDGENEARNHKEFTDVETENTSDQTGPSGPLYPDYADVQKKGHSLVDQKLAEQFDSEADNRCGEVFKNRIQAAQEVMFAICREMGFGQEQIDNVVLGRGSPFDDIDEIVEEISQLQPCLQQGTYTGANNDFQPYNTPHSGEYVAASNELLRTTVTRQSDLARQQLLLCVKCPARKGKAQPATHVALPCGDLILCEECNREEIEMKRSNPEYELKCPRCNKDIAGTMHVFFS